MFVVRDEGGVIGEVVPAFHAEGMDLDNDGCESGSSASHGRGAARRAPAGTSAQILVSRGDSGVLLLSQCYRFISSLHCYDIVVMKTAPYIVITLLFRLYFRRKRENY